MPKLPDSEIPRTRGRPRAFNEKTEQNTIKSLDRALGVLKELAQIESATLSELATAMKESPATLYRVLTTFALHGIVEMDETAQTWHIGPEAYQIGSAFLRRTSLIDVSRPILRKLMQETGETANLGIEKNGSVFFMPQIETNAPIRAFFPPGTLSEMHASGIGKALLAHMDETQLKRFAARGLQTFTPHTLATPESLAADMVTTRERGYALDDQEKNLGMRCIAAPIQDAYGEVIAGISVSGPTTRVSTDHIETLAKSVMRAAQDVSNALGAKTSEPS